MIAPEDLEQVFYEIEERIGIMTYDGGVRQEEAEDVHAAKFFEPGVSDSIIRSHYKTWRGTIFFICQPIIGVTEPPLSLFRTREWAHPR